MLPRDNLESGAMGNPPASGQQLTPTRGVVLYHYRTRECQDRLCPVSPLRPLDFARRTSRGELDRSRLGSAGEGPDRVSLPAAVVARRLTLRALRRPSVTIQKTRLRRRLRSCTLAGGRYCKPTSSEDDTVFNQCPDSITTTPSIFHDLGPSSSLQRDSSFNTPTTTTITLTEAAKSACRLQQHMSAPQTLSSAEIQRIDDSTSRINISLPADPREWSRQDVSTWLLEMRRLHNVPDLDLDRFPMNGKALCIMTPAMFTFRVPSTGLTLYGDFQTRFHRAVMRQRSNLRS